VRRKSLGQVLRQAKGDLLYWFHSRTKIS
jgi:hypothetical protein